MLVHATCYCPTSVTKEAIFILWCPLSNLITFLRCYETQFILGFSTLWEGLSSFSSVLKVFLLTLTILSDFERVTVDSSCELDWSNHLDNCYFFPGDKKDWASAKQECWNQKALLVTVFNQAEQSFIDEVLDTGGKYWIGLSGNVDAQNFTWVHGKTAAIFPIIEEGSGEVSGNVCVYIDDVGQWRLSQCASSKKYVCKRPDCSDGLRLDADVEARGDCLIFQSGALSWQDARTQCQSLNGDTDLASPTNDQFRNFLQNNYANDTNTQNFWLGMEYSSGAISLLSRQTTDWSASDRDGMGGECIAWLNQQDYGEIHDCSYQLHALCQRSIYYYKEECNGFSSLGMEDGSISNAQITASSAYSGLHAKKGRLNGADYWATEPKNPSDPWIQVDLLDNITVAGIRTQGSAHSDPEWVTKLKTQTGESENALTYINEDNGQPKIFSANTDKDTAVNIFFPELVETRYLRIRPTEWHNWCALRFEVIGCETEAPTTTAPTTTAPTTTAPTTMALTTSAPTTESPTTPTTTTEIPTTESPTTAAPTTEATTAAVPTTESPTTTVSTTQTPSTAAPTTAAATTAAITTKAPTTQAATTNVPTTQAATTNAPTTQAATTKVPTTQAATTNAPTTQSATTKAPTTQAATTKAPTTQPAAANTNPPTTKATATTRATTAATPSTAAPTKSQDKLDSFQSAVSQPDVTDDDIREIEEWLIDHRTFPDDVTDRDTYVETYLSVCSDMISDERSAYYTNNQTKSGGASEVAVSCSSLVDDLAKISDTDNTIVTPNIVAAVKAFPNASSFEDIRVEPTDGSQVVITKEDFDKLGIDDGQKISVSITTYKNGELLTGRSVQSREKGESSPVSGVVAITVFANGVKTSMKVSFKLPVDKNKVENAKEGEEPTCVYQTTDNNGEPIWDTQGCEVTNSTDTSITCQCNHTTNFAILMQVKDVKISKQDELALNWITYICCSLSIVALLITLIVLLALRSMLRSERVIIHVNLVIALILAQTLLLLSTPAAATPSVCRAVAIMLHYFFTAAFCWMLVEGVHLYLQIVRVFSAGKDRLIPYCLVGWGIPLLIVVITAGARWDGYGDNGRCWLSTTHGMVWAFVAPALVIIAVNFVILIMVLRILVVSSKAKSDGDYDHIKAGLKGAVLLLPLLGVTWLFGVISVSAHTVVFLYLFSIFNSLQGVFIFLIYCVFNGEVRNAVNRHKEKRALTRGDMVSTMDSMSDSKSKSKANRVHPDSQTKETEMVDIQSTTTTTTHTQMLIRRQPGHTDEPKKGASIADVD